MFILSGFADEISDDLNTQIDVLNKLNVSHLELRGVWGKNVLTLSDDEIETVRQSLTERGIKVSAIGSPIGKIDIEDPFEPHLDDFRRAIQIARALDCPYIRIFSFFVPEDKADDYRPQVMERMQALLDVARGEPVTLLHENERHIYGDIPRRCRDLFETLASPQLRMTFDPANFVMCDVRPFTEGYELLKDYIDYVHIKDGLMEEKRVVPAGQGDGEVKELLIVLKKRGYDGFLSLEPHLAHAGEFSGFSGPDLFGIAVNALRDLLAQIDE
ncbi:MAG TPA: sugar phosphate isomerase/epimerase [Chloroflexi bacterium]|jgi:3-dehydroshikimate dehydratase|nr:sugar phosphate isomerase/epimerase [Chloroflexota bacterium]